MMKFLRLAEKTLAVETIQRYGESVEITGPGQVKDASDEIGKTLQEVEAATLSEEGQECIPGFGRGGGSSVEPAGPAGSPDLQRQTCGMAGAVGALRELKGPASSIRRCRSPSLSIA